MTDNKALVRRFVTGYQSNGDPAVCAALVADDFVNHTAPPGLPPGRAGLMALVDGLRSAFAELRAEIHDQIAEGDRVVTRKSLHGRHVGEFMAVPPSGRDVTIDIIDIVRVDDGKIVEHWGHVDQLGLLRQMGGPPD